MKKSTLLLTIAIIAVSVTRVSATGEVPEELVYEGTSVSLLTLPLEPYVDALPERPKELCNVRCSAISRGYIGEWLIKDGKLFLVCLHQGCVTGDEIPLSRLFPNAPEPVLASWYSGVLRVGQGEVLR